MAYINSDGSVEQSRSWFRFSIVTDFVWGVINTVGLFVDTLINPRKPIPKGKFISNNQSNAATSRPGINPGRANIKTLPKNCASGG